MVPDDLEVRISKYRIRQLQQRVAIGESGDKSYYFSCNIIYWGGGGRWEGESDCSHTYGKQAREIPEPLLPIRNSQNCSTDGTTPEIRIFCSYYCSLMYSSISRMSIFLWTFVFGMRKFGDVSRDPQ